MQRSIIAPDAGEAKRQKQAVDYYLHQIALLTLAETPIKSLVKRRTQNLRAEILSGLKPENREAFTAGRNAILTLARTLANAQTPEQLANILTALQNVNE